MGVFPPNPFTWDPSDPENYIDCLAYGGYAGPTHDDSGTPTSLPPGDGTLALVRVEDTGRLSEDRYRLEDIVRLLLEFPGGFAVTLEIRTGARVVRMDMAFARVDPCPDLEKRLRDLVGQDNVSLPVTAD